MTPPVTDRRTAGTVSRGANPVITGIGVVAPTGIGAEAHWESVLAGKSGIGRITRFAPSQYPVQLAGQVADFVAADRVPSRLIPQTDRWTHLGLAAAEAALADAAIDPAQLPEYEMAVVTSSSSGGTEFGQHEMERLYRHGPSWVGAYQSIAWFYAATTGQVSIRHGMRGPCGVFCCEQAGGLDALGQARRLIRSGSRLVITGGTDASLCPYGLTAQLATGKLSTVIDAKRAYLPFDVDASGYLPGEGGAILVVEHADSAAQRGAGGYGTLLGYAAGFDPAPETGRLPALRRTIESALRDAGVRPCEVDVVFADASGVPREDLAEAEAIVAVFGPYALPVTAPKTLTGRLYGGGAALDVATALLALRDQVVPHTTGPSRLMPGYDIDLVRDQPRQRELDTALVVARGHGGFTAAVVLGRKRASPQVHSHSYQSRAPAQGEDLMQEFTLEHLKEVLRASGGVDGAVDLDGDVLDTPFAELGYDSLAMLELAGRVQRDFRVPMPDDAQQHMPTPQAALAYINARFVEAGV